MSGLDRCRGSRNTARWCSGSHRYDGVTWVVGLSLLHASLLHGGAAHAASFTAGEPTARGRQPLAAQRGSSLQLPLRTGTEVQLLLKRRGSAPVSPASHSGQQSRPATQTRSAPLASATAPLASATAPPASATAPPASATAPPASATAPPASATAPPAFEPSSALQVWGWLLIATSVCLGAAALSYGLTIECDDQDVPCQRHAGLAIWGGSGIASVGSFVGFTLLHWPSGNTPKQPQVALGVNVGSMPLGLPQLGLFSEARWRSSSNPEPTLVLRIAGW